MDKVVRNGEVAVIVSPGFGAGWSTWANDGERAAFDPDIVAWIEGGKVGEPPVRNGDYAGGLRDAVVMWIPEGTRFYIDEYDGHENLVIYSGDHYLTA